MRLRSGLSEFQVPERTVLGYFAALAVSGLALWLEAFLFGHSRLLTPSFDLSRLLFTIVFVAGVTFATAFASTAIPFVVYIAIASFFKIKSPVYYVCGGMILANSLLFFQLIFQMKLQHFNSTDWLCFCFNGAMGGLVYWLVAIRRSRSVALSP